MIDELDLNVAPMIGIALEMDHYGTEIMHVFQSDNLDEFIEQCWWCGFNPVRVTNTTNHEVLSEDKLAAIYEEYDQNREIERALAKND